MKKRNYILSLLLIITTTAFTQEMRFSLTTDLAVQRSLKKEQQFWAAGQTIQGIFHITPKAAVYIWGAYYTNGNFRNVLTATAKSPTTLPQQINYISRSKMRFKHISIGFKKYLVGASDNQKGWNLYASAGLGLLPGKVTNTHTVDIDTAIYNVPVLNGVANFKRLTADLALGYEKPLATDFYIYAEGKVWVPASDYPSKHIFINENAPFAIMLGIGLRILF